MNKTTEEKLKDLIVDQLGVNLEDIKSESDIISDLGADSLDQVELIMAIEEEFEIEIQDEEAEKLKTVAELLACIEAKL